MKVDETSDGSLTITYDSSTLTKWMGGLTTVFLGVAAYDVLVGTRGTDRLLGLLGAAATCFLIGIVFLEIASFRFATSTRIVTWRRRWALRERSGTMSFAAIESVQIETPIGDSGIPSRRISLWTADGVAIPITVGFRPDADGAIKQTAARLRTLLGHPSGKPLMRDVDAMVRAGRVVDAIRVLRQEEGLSLTEAKQRVDAWRGHS